jgi:hypothetical protein
MGYGGDIGSGDATTTVCSGGSGWCLSWTHGLLAGERANEDQLPLLTVRTDPRLLPNGTPPGRQRDTGGLATSIQLPADPSLPPAPARSDRFYPRRRAIGESKVVYRRNQRLGMGVITRSELCPDCHHGDQRCNQTILQDNGGPLVER